jgi:hypothetical protein
VVQALVDQVCGAAGLPQAQYPRVEALGDAPVRVDTRGPGWALVEAQLRPLIEALPAKVEFDELK